MASVARSSVMRKERESLMLLPESLAVGVGFAGIRRRPSLLGQEQLTYLSGQWVGRCGKCFAAGL
jgi:hypothetical protein